jgi:phage shock protein PspC (stress-responsive transcriptional regulator)
MTENNTNSSSATTLRRSADRKIFAGVSGGLGEHFGINAWWFRWAFIILAFFGFAGVALYILAWLLIPRADGSESVAGGWFDDLDMTDAGTLFGVVLIGVAALIVATSVFHISGAIVIAVALGIVGFLLYRGDLRPPVNVTITRDDDDPGPGTPSPVQPEESGAIVVATKPQKPPKVKKPRKPPSMLGRLTMAVLLIVISTMALLEAADVAHFEAVEFAGAAMAVVALGLIIGAFIGRAKWLILIGLLLLPVLLTTSLLPRVEAWSVGDPFHRPATIEQVKDSYDLGMGQLTLDLTLLTAEELAQVAVIEADVGLGQLVIWLPAEIGATVDAEVGAGAITGVRSSGSLTLDSYEYSGIGVDQRLEIGTPPFDLHLVLEVGIGEINIRHVGSIDLDAIDIEE